MSGGNKNDEESHRIYDLGNLMMVDTRTYENIGDQELQERINKNYQSVLQSLIALKEKNAKGPVDYDKPILEVNLPDKIMEFPRQKPIPKPKPLSKWEKFRTLKGLRPRKKRGRFVFDEMTKSWVPRYGFKSIKHIHEDAEDIIEDKKGLSLAEEDPFQKRKQDKKLVMDKQKLRELKNKQHAQRTEKVKDGLSDALKIAQKSTASMGKHDKKVNKKEKEAKPQREKINTAKWKLTDEKKRNMDILKIMGKRAEPEEHKKEERPRKSKKDDKRKTTH